jgi:PAS domain S-box-containing protein
MHRLDTFANQLPALVGYWNTELRCEFANDAYLEWFGLSPAKIIGKRLVELLGEDLFRLNEPYARLALQGHAQRFEREIRKADGSIGYTDARYIPDSDEHGIVRGFFVLVSDITELHHAYSRVRELAQRLESAREDERRSVAKTLHEGMAQDLFGCVLTLAHLKSRLAHDEDGQVAANQIKALLDKCIAQTRRIAGDLHPQALSHFSLIANIESYAKFVESSTGLKICVTEAGSLPELDEDIRLMFYRAAQEALTNVTRHANARNTNITLRATRDTVTMEVIDDGIGMPVGALHKRGSVGLLGMRERFESLGGKLMVDRNMPLGTKLMVRLPIPNSRATVAGLAESGLS